MSNTANILSGENSIDMRDVFMQAPVAIMMLKGRNYFVELANDSYLEIIGKGAEFVGNPLFESLPELEGQGIRELLDEVMQSGLPFYGNELEFSLLRGNKKQKGFFSFACHAISQKNKTTSGVLVVINEVTDQVVSRKRLEESELRFRNLVEQAVNPICILKGEDMILEIANAPVYKVWNVGSEVLGKPFLDIVPEMKGQPFMGLLLDVFRNGTTRYGYEQPAYFNRADGVQENHYFNFVYQPYRENDGAISGVLVFATDVTGHVLSQKNIELSEKRYQNLIQSLPVAIYTCDKDGYIQLYNKAAAELWGCEPRIGKDRWCGSWKLYDLDGVSLPLDIWPMALTIREGRTVDDKEIIIEQPTGRQRFVIPYPQPVFDNNGILTGAINTLIETTGIRKSQQELLDQEIQFYNENLENEQLRAKELEENVLQRTLELQKVNEVLREKNHEIEITREKLLSDYARSLIEASLDPLITISSAGKITDMNEAFATITGEVREKLIGTDFGKYFTDPQKAREIYREVFSKGFVTNYPLTIIDGHLTDVLFNGSIYKNDKGVVLGAVVVARVITEQKRIEKELIEAKVFAELATLLAEEAKTKAENATRIAEDAVKSKQQFLSNMSHEIRTPMNAITGFTKVVLKTDLTAKQKEYLTAIQMSGDALIVLINDILDLAKVDAGKMTFEQVPFKMAFSIAAMLHLFETKIQEKNLELVKIYDPAIPEVLIGDPIRLHQIILNLVSNAVKFTTTGKITVSVRKMQEDDKQVTIEFAIMDTGIGIPENDLVDIFENFQQASGGTARIYGGTGLGLAIAKQLVEKQGGEIWVKSKLGAGSTFSFILSFQKTDIEAQIETPIIELDTEINNIKVLVVEDMALNQLLMKTLLDDFGFERDIAENGKIALEKLQNKSYDIILMDLQMPEMNGFEATEYIRNVLHSKIPIIALTADVTTVDLAKCKAVGMDDYIAKPVDERLLYTKIVGLVKKYTPKASSKESESNNSKKTKYTDLDYLILRTKNNSGMIMEMISAYLEQTPPLIAAMKQSFLDKDWDSLHAATHKMIPSFSIMGMSTDFEEKAKKVQEFARNQQHLAEEINEMVLQIEAACNQACIELEADFIRIKNMHE